MKTMQGIQTRSRMGHPRHGTSGKPVVWTVGLAMLAMVVPLQSAWAQSPPDNPINVQGTVINQETGKPVDGAVVSLTKEPTGVLTNSHGKFTLDKVTPGKVSISAQKLGYETLTWQGALNPDTGPLTLKLPPKDSLLNALNTEVARFARRRRSAPVAVQYFGRKALESSSQPNVMDFVNTHAGVSNVDCPGLLGSDQCYMVQGMIVLPIVYVDDVPMSGGEGYLESLSPQDLYGLEVYANGAEIRVYTPHFMVQAARTDYRPRPLGL